MIGNFFKTAFSIYRQEWNSPTPGVNLSTETFIADFNGHIQYASPEFLVSLGMTATKAFVIWCPLATDVKDGDVIKTTTDMYAVKGVQKYSYGCNQHTKIVVQWYGTLPVSSS